MSEISQLMEDYLESSRIKDSSEHKKKDKKFYLSDSNKCMRMRWLKRKGVETEFDPHVLWIFKIGDMYHDFAYKVLESQGVPLSAEEYLENDHFIGRYDGIVKTKEGKAVIDIKSAGAYKIKRIQGGEDDDNYVAQVLTYQLFLNESGHKDIKKSIILFMNKEPKDDVPTMFLQKNYYLTSWRKKKIKEQMDELVEYWEKDELPPCTCPAWMKNYNAFQPFCGEKDDKKVLKVLKHLEKDKKLITTKETLYLVDGNKRKAIKETG